MAVREKYQPFQEGRAMVMFNRNKHRFTMGRFGSLAEAREFAKLAASNRSHCFVEVYLFIGAYKGKLRRK